jgi:hypothetical protein
MHWKSSEFSLLRATSSSFQFSPVVTRSKVTNAVPTF